MIKKEQGSRTYNAQFLQDPTPPGGFLINTGWFRRWKNLPIFNEELMKKRKDKYKIIMAWDMNFKKKVGADNVACSVFLTDFVTTYLIDKFEEQVGFIETLDEVTKMKDKWEFILFKSKVSVPIEIIIEDKANGPAIMEVLQLKIPGILPITPVEDKVTRMTSITTFIEAGNVLVPSLDTSDALVKHSWLPDALEELAKFPNVQHDDFSDSFSIGLRRIYVEPSSKRKPMRIF